MKHIRTLCARTFSLFQDQFEFDRKLGVAVGTIVIASRTNRDRLNDVRVFERLQFLLEARFDRDSLFTGDRCRVVASDARRTFDDTTLRRRIRHASLFYHLETMIVLHQLPLLQIVHRCTSCRHVPSGGRGETRRFSVRGSVSTDLTLLVLRRRDVRRFETLPFALRSNRASARLGSREHTFSTFHGRSTERLSRSNALSISLSLSLSLVARKKRYTRRDSIVFHASSANFGKMFERRAAPAVILQHGSFIDRMDRLPQAAWQVAFSVRKTCVILVKEPLIASLGDDLRRRRDDYHSSHVETFMYVYYPKPEHEERGTRHETRSSRLSFDGLILYFLLATMTYTCVCIYRGIDKQKAAARTDTLYVNTKAFLDRGERS